MRMSDTHLKAGQRAKKRATNLTLDEGLLARARALGLNLSSVVEEVLRERIRAEEAHRWLSEHKVAIDELNRETELHGLWSERLRQF
jgi:antitoxin CcdA